MDMKDWKEYENVFEKMRKEREMWNDMRYGTSCSEVKPVQLCCIAAYQFKLVTVSASCENVMYDEWCIISVWVSDIFDMSLSWSVCVHVCVCVLVA